MTRYRETFRRPPTPKTKAEHDAWIRAAERGGEIYEDDLPASILWEVKLSQILHLAPAETVIVRRGHDVRVQSTVARGHYGAPTLTPATRAKRSRDLTPAARRRETALHETYVAGPPAPPKSGQGNRRRRRRVYGHPASAPAYTLRHGQDRGN